jgi:mersacidin/lichenicidin family type 2 lantibiotic
MKEVDKIVRAWRDEDYRLSLSNEDLSGLPENPVGIVELSDDALNSAAGGAIISSTIMCQSPLCIPPLVAGCFTK